MLQWFHACWMLKLSLEHWSVVVLNPDTNQSARSVCLFSDEFSLLVFQNNQRSHNSLSNRRTKHRTYVNNNQRNMYRHTENNRNRNKQKKKDFDQWHFYFNFPLPAALFLLSYTTDRKLQITEWNRNSWGAESNVTWLILGAVGLEYHRI